MKTFFIIKNSLYPEWYELQLLFGEFYSLRKVSNNWQANNLPISKESINKVLTASGFCSCSEAYLLGTEKFFGLLSFLGWSADDWWAYTCCKKQTIIVYAHANKVVFDLLTWDHIDGDICYCSTLQSFRDLQRLFPEKKFELSNDAKCALEGAIDYFLGSYGKVEYLAESLSFRVTEYTPKPVYYGGSIDCVDFDEDEYVLTLEEAYDRYKNFKSEFPASVDEYEEEELPF